jgi:hypothetical protein
MPSQPIIQAVRKALSAARLETFESALPVPHLRHRIYLDLKVLRELRNRIAHYEPVLKRDLMTDYRRMIHLVDQRCTITAVWTGSICGDVPQLIERRP